MKYGNCYVHAFFNYEKATAREKNERVVKICDGCDWRNDISWNVPLIM